MKKIAIMMRITLAAEALNNEESVGNVVIPRSILINDEERQAISGDTLKHQHTRNLRLLADENELCDGCKIFSPNKNTKAKENDKNLSESGNRTKNCIIDDVEGFMDPKGSAKKTSPVKFSFAIATEENDYQNLLHTKVDTTDAGGKKKAQGEEKTQMLFYKPVRSNNFALTVQMDLDRIGFDDQTLKLAVTEEVQLSRQNKAIRAFKNMIVDMQGAMCSTRLPHIMNVEGVVVRKKIGRASCRERV